MKELGRPKWRPFAEWRTSDWIISASLGVSRAAPGIWIPHIWLQIGPLCVGIGAVWNGDES